MGRQENSMKLILVSKNEIASPPASLVDRNDGGMDSRFRGNDSWINNPDIQKLLDVISEIIANEYIEVAKKNRNVFCKGGVA